MTHRRSSVAMTVNVQGALMSQLVRRDGQEDLCLATYRPSSGATRTSALINKVILPQPGDRQIHGNATITADYILRGVESARDDKCGVVLIHSHPGQSGWQTLSRPDRNAESSYANLVRELTGLPLVGMTLATNDRTWSARHWDKGVGRQVDCTPSTNVRVIGERFTVSWNDAICPPPTETKSQVRTVSSWGNESQANLARLKILVVGAGSVGLDVAVRLAAAGLCQLTIMDFDVVEVHNLDRLIGAGSRDAFLRRPKIHVAQRETVKASTAKDFSIKVSDRSICEPDGLKLALDHDLIFSCVDRPWPRNVLNTIAYTDLIPVIDGGIAIDTFEDGAMRNATWRSHVIHPQRPCMICNQQLDPNHVSLDQQGKLDDPAYISKAELVMEPTNQNVAPLSINVAASLLAQFISLTVSPADYGDPGPLQYIFSTHELKKDNYKSRPHCYVEKKGALGDNRSNLTSRHQRAEQKRQVCISIKPRIRFLRLIDHLITSANNWLDNLAHKGS